jgi:cell division protein ZapB
MQSVPRRLPMPHSRTVIVPRMTTPDAVKAEIDALSRTLDRLLETVRRLNEENRSLRHSQEQLSNERAGLMARNEQARNRVEAMIQRLKSLESNG